MTLIEPEMGPRSVRDEIPRPRMTCLVRDNIDVTPIPRNQSRRHSRQIGVLHAAVGEGFWEDEDVVGCPFVGDDEGFCDGDEGLGVLFEFVLTVF
jgi:hypothetical protein